MRAFVNFDASIREEMDRSAEPERPDHNRPLPSIAIAILRGQRDLHPVTNPGEQGSWPALHSSKIASMRSIAFSGAPSSFISSISEDSPVQ